MKPAIEKFHVVRPLVLALAVIVTTVALIFAIYFTERSKLWVPFLAGILVSSTLAAARLIHTERIAIHRAEELIDIKIKLERQKEIYKIAEEAVAASKSKLILIDEVLPIMVAFIDINGLCNYYNRRFMDWLHLQPQQINGRHIREVLGIKIYRELATYIRQSLDGHPVLYERTQEMTDGMTHKLLIEHLPQFDDNKKVSGFYMIINDITSPYNIDTSDQLKIKEMANFIKTPNTRDSTHKVRTNSGMLVTDPFGEHEIVNYKRILNAIENGEYCLFLQLIKSVAVDSTEAEYYEILIRLKQTDKVLLVPKEFLPVAQMNGHMLYLDRWVVTHIIEWVSLLKQHDRKRKNLMLFINLSEDSISDPEFPEFLKTSLQDHNISGTTLCFEIPAVELVLRNSEIAKFTDEVKKLGCRIAICGFGQDRIIFDLMQGIKVDFVKIDGSIIRNILYETTNLATVTAICKEVKKFNMQTIAESVENEEIIIKLQEIGINFIQGYRISRPDFLKNYPPRTYWKANAALE